MEEQSPPKPGSDGGNKAVTQLVQIKYILAGMLGLAVFGRSGDLNTNLLAVATTLLFVYTMESSFDQLSASAKRLVSIRQRRKAAAAESAQRMRKLLRELEEVEQQVRNE